jgi:hypothetical protein
LERVEGDAKYTLVGTVGVMLVAAKSEASQEDLANVIIPKA